MRISEVIIAEAINRAGQSVCDQFNSSGRISDEHDIEVLGIGFEKLENQLPDSSNTLGRSNR